MKRLTLEEVVQAVGGRPCGRLAVGGVIGVSTDSRRLVAGELFFAIAGERFDGHAFVEQALAAGACAAVVSGLDPLPEHLRADGRVILVGHTTEALGRLAAYHRRQIAATVIGVVGSNGKTTTKSLIDSVLRPFRRGRSSHKSFNNHIGVPLTLLAADASDEYLVVEIGTNHPGEVAALADMARPDIGVVTSLGEEHLEFFGDLSGVATEELSLLRFLRPRGMAILHEDCRAHPAAAEREDLTRLTFGFGESADLRAAEMTWDGRAQRFRVNGRFQYELPAAGVHNACNALAAVAVGLRFGLSHEQIADGLRAAAPPAMRFERRRIGEFTVINDAYNANPSSARAAFAALETLSEPGRRVLVLGDMRELGASAARCHQELGQAAGRTSAGVIIAIGGFARTVADGATATGGFRKKIYWYPALEAAAASLERILEPGDVILLKGSRALRLERLLPEFERLSTAGAAS